jgi:hypothetical protein
MTRQTCPQTTRYATRQIARIDKTDKSMGFFYNMMDKPIKDSTWKVYTVQGKIDKNAKWLYFGGLYQHKGYFNFDDFQVFIETSHNKWQQLPLPDPGFEDDTAAFNKNWFYLKKRTFFTPRLSTDNPYEDKQAIKIDGSKFIKTQTDGDNDTAGHFITANGIKLYYETYGQGQPLLLLHGNSSSISLFEKQIPDFSKQYQVIAVDTRGQGRSGEDGKTGLIMAMNYPRKVRRLAAMGANVFIDHTVVDDSVYRSSIKNNVNSNTTNSPAPPTATVSSPSSLPNPAIPSHSSSPSTAQSSSWPVSMTLSKMSIPARSPPISQDPNSSSSPAVPSTNPPTTPPLSTKPSSTSSTLPPQNKKATRSPEWL